MDYSKSLRSLLNHAPASLLHFANDCHNGYFRAFNALVSSGKLPAEGLTDMEIEFFLNQFSLMDSNNIIGRVGMGEREARVQSSLIQKRYWNLLHGIGRSGELLAMQPKAVGSSILQKLTHHLVADALTVFGIGSVGKVLVLPVATGMALTLCLLNLKLRKPGAKYVVFLRIDQKSCIKSISAAGLVPLVVGNLRQTLGCPDAHVPGLSTDLPSLQTLLQKVDASEILCVMSTTSCFAPREPDDVVEVGTLARKHALFHVVNNAYGLQSTKSCDMINKANAGDLLDYVVQSTDKNFLVPVGGAVVFAKDPKLIKELNNNYPGRASAGQIIDLFISLLTSGRKGLLQLLAERKEAFATLLDGLHRLAAQFGEKVIQNKRNNISIAFTLVSLGPAATEFGSWLFRKGIMGARVVAADPVAKAVGGLSLCNFGGHTDDASFPFPYITVAAAIGTSKKEVDRFLGTFEETLVEFREKKAKSTAPKDS